jgi:flagellin-like protein
MTAAIPPQNAVTALSTCAGAPAIRKAHKSAEIKSNNIQSQGSAIPRTCHRFLTRQLVGSARGGVPASSNYRLRRSQNLFQEEFMPLTTSRRAITPIVATLVLVLAILCTAAGPARGAPTRWRDCETLTVKDGVAALLPSAVVVLGRLPKTTAYFIATKETSCQSAWKLLTKVLRARNERDALAHAGFRVMSVRHHRYRQKSYYTVTAAGSGAARVQYTRRGTHLAR